MTDEEDIKRRLEKVEKLAKELDLDLDEFESEVNTNDEITYRLLLSMVKLIFRLRGQLDGLILAQQKLLDNLGSDGILTRESIIEIVEQPQPPPRDDLREKYILIGKSTVFEELVPGLQLDKQTGLVRLRPSERFVEPDKLED